MPFRARERGFGSFCFGAEGFGKFGRRAYVGDAAFVEGYVCAAAFPEVRDVGLALGAWGEGEVGRVGCEWWVELGVLFDLRES